MSSRKNNIAIVDDDLDAWAMQPQEQTNDDLKPASTRFRPIHASRSTRDLSPPRQPRPQRDLSPPCKHQRDLSPPRKMASGARAGLSTAAEARREADRRRQEEQQRLASMPVEQSGRQAQTVYRDTSGRILNVQAEKERQRLELEQKRLKEQQRLEDAKGSAQRRERELERNRLREAATTSFSRYADDVEMNETLKERTHWDDPLKHKLTATKKKKDAKPAYQGPPGPPNRFHIPPGHRWDGVDRSNGFESKWFRAQARRQHLAAEEYKWGAEDM